MTITCVIVDDNVHFLKAAGAFLEREGLAVVAMVTNSAEALRQAEDLRPDVLLVDIELGPESGLDLTVRLMDGGSADRPPVILMSAHSADEFGDLIAASPALGFLPKTRLSGREIRRLVDGGTAAAG